MKYCGQCGWQLPDEACFCNKCGAAVSAQEVTTVIMGTEILPSAPSATGSEGGEIVLADVSANLFRGIEAVGGRMKITSQRLIFEAHALNLQRKPLEIPVREISDVLPRRTLGVVPNGILIKTKSGIEYKFVVWNREQLINLIKSIISGVREN